MLNYLKGAKICENNSDRLATSGRIIIKDHDGTKAFGLFLLYMAYEEMAKAIFCFFIHKRWITPSFANQVFTHHQPKIILLDEFFKSFEVQNGIPYLGGKKLGQISLNRFIDKNYKKIQTHRTLTNQLIYVNRYDGWHIPVRDIKKVMKKKKDIETKILSMATVLEALRREGSSPHLSNFRLLYAKNGRVTISYTTKPSK